PRAARRGGGVLRRRRPRPRGHRPARRAHRTAHAAGVRLKARVLARLIEIQRVLVRHGLDDFVRATHLYRPLRYLHLASPWAWFERRHGASRGERLRLALEELGPIFVKFGQAVSTRR